MLLLVWERGWLAAAKRNSSGTCLPAAADTAAHKWLAVPSLSKPARPPAAPPPARPRPARGAVWQSLSGARDTLIQQQFVQILYVILLAIAQHLLYLAFNFAVLQ